MLRYLDADNNTPKATKRIYRKGFNLDGISAEEEWQVSCVKDSANFCTVVKAKDDVGVEQKVLFSDLDRDKMEAFGVKQQYQRAFMHLLILLRCCDFC